MTDLDYTQITDSQLGERSGEPSPIIYATTSTTSLLPAYMPSAPTVSTDEINDDKLNDDKLNDDKLNDNKNNSHTDDDKNDANVNHASASNINRLRIHRDQASLYECCLECSFGINVFTNGKSAYFVDYNSENCVCVVACGNKAIASALSFAVLVATGITWFLIV